MTVQVKAQFTKDDSQFNGLDAVRKELIAAPLTPRVVIAVIEVVAVTHDILTGADTPKVRLRQVEVLDGTPAAKAVDLMNARYSERTGRTDSQASLFDAFEELPRDHDGPSGDEILAERAEARAAGELVDSIDEALAANAAGDGADPDAQDGQPWPGDVAFVAPPAAGDEAAEAPAATTRKPRKRA